MKRFIIEKSEDEFYTSHSGIALIGLCLNRYTSLSKRLAGVSSLKKEMTTRPSKKSSGCKWPSSGHPGRKSRPAASNPPAVNLAGDQHQELQVATFCHYPAS